MFTKYASKLICVDATHGTTAYDFQLITVLVIDDYDEGIPCGMADKQQRIGGCPEGLFQEPQRHVWRCPNRILVVTHGHSWSLVVIRGLSWSLVCTFRHDPARQWILRYVIQLACRLVTQRDWRAAEPLNTTIIS